MKYSHVLEFLPEWVTSKRSQKTYKLHGIVYHHGTLSNGGHYTCDVQVGNTEWIHMDDSQLHSSNPQEVLQEHPHRHAYMLFYTSQNE